MNRRPLYVFESVWWLVFLTLAGIAAVWVDLRAERRCRNAGAVMVRTRIGYECAAKTYTLAPLDF